MRDPNEIADDLDEYGDPVAALISEEASDALRHLAAENQRLRDALRESAVVMEAYADYWKPPHDGHVDGIREAIRIARASLGEDT